MATRRHVTLLCHADDTQQLCLQSEAPVKPWLAGGVGIPRLQLTRPRAVRRPLGRRTGCCGRLIADVNADEPAPCVLVHAELHLAWLQSEESVILALQGKLSGQVHSNNDSGFPKADKTETV